MFPILQIVFLQRACQWQWTDLNMSIHYWLVLPEEEMRVNENTYKGMNTIRSI